MTVHVTMMSSCVCVFVLSECDKAICLNELGRMMSWYGDRQYSGTFFRKSLDTVLDMLKDDTLMSEKRLENFHPKLVHNIYTNFSWCALFGLYRCSLVHMP